MTGWARYTHDYRVQALSVQMVISPYGHARIVDLDDTEARKLAGVRAIVTGGGFPLNGEAIRDRPPLAYGKVRYHGEPVALVVADTPVQAKKAAEQVKVRYELLPVVHSPTDAFQEGAPLVHERLGEYHAESGVKPVPGTNIAAHVKIRKGEMEQGWAESKTVVEASFSFFTVGSCCNGNEMRNCGNFTGWNN